MYQGYYTIDLRKKSTEGSMKLVTDIGPLYIQFSGVVSPDRKYYYTVLNTIEKRDFATNRLLAIAADLDKSYYTIQISSDGKKLYLGGGGDTILIYEHGNDEAAEEARHAGGRGPHALPRPETVGGAAACS